MSNREHAKTDVLQGTLDLMVLKTLSTLGPVHGYAITPVGTRQLAAEKAEWDRMASIIQTVLADQG